MATNEEMINKLYDSQLASQREQLAADYDAANADLDAQKAKNQKATDANLNAAAVQARKAAVSNAEYYNASGLSSGARAQARLAQENQLQANLTALRTAQQEADAEIERQRGLLAKEYAGAIRQAQADNDLARAQALYQEAKDADAKLLAQREGAAGLMAQVGDYSGYGALYGLTPEQITMLGNSYTEEKGRSDKEAAAMLLAQAGDYSRLGALYGLTPEEISKLNGSAVSSGNGGNSSGGTIQQNWDNNGYTEAEIAELQKELKVSQDGLWGPVSQAAAKERWGVTSAADAYKMYAAESAGSGSGVISNWFQFVDAVASQNKAGIKALTTQYPEIDTASLAECGYGNASAEEISAAVDAGILESYVENGKTKFRKTAKGLILQDFSLSGRGMSK